MHACGVIIKPVLSKSCVKISQIWNSQTMDNWCSYIICRSTSTETTHSSKDIKGGLLSHCDGHYLPSERNRHVGTFPHQIRGGREERMSCTTCRSYRDTDRVDWADLLNSFRFSREARKGCVSRMASSSMRKQGLHQLQNGNVYTN